MARTVLHPDPLLRPAMAFGCLMGMAILIAAFGPKADLQRSWQDAQPVQLASLGFTDEPGGAVVVSDTLTGRQIARLDVGEGGFVRSTMRSLARERMRRDIARDPPFELARFADRSLILRDPQTGRSIDLVAFGDDNEAAFAAFLDHGREPQ